jgi:hypothetical protein
LSLGPESRAILKELSKIRQVLAGNLSTNIQQGELFYQQFILDKSSTFTDFSTEININSFNLFNISVSKNANISSVSYKVLSKTGVLSNEIEARLLPRLAGENARLYINNDTAESGEEIIIDCFTAAPSILGALSTSFRNNEDIFTDSPSDAAAGNNSLSVLSNGMLYDSYSDEFNRERGKTTKIALSNIERSATVTSDSISLYNCQNLFIELFVDASTGGNLTVDLLLNSRVSGSSSYKLGSSGTFTSSKLFLANKSSFQTGGLDDIEEYYNTALPDSIKIKVTVSAGTHTFGVNIIQC